MSPVHNHGPAEGRGLDCGEAMVDGKLRGHCLDASTDEVFDIVFGPARSLPVPAETVALLKMPVPLGALGAMVAGLKGTYGDGLEIRTDAGVDGWMVIATPSSPDSGSDS